MPPFRVADFDSVQHILKEQGLHVEMRDLGKTRDYGAFAFVSGFRSEINEEWVAIDTADYRGLTMAYYPDCKFLLMEGGHSTEEGYDLKTGKNEDEVGSPAGERLSLDKMFRVRYVYRGQECSTIFFQEKEGDEYVNIHISNDVEFFCSLYNSFWADNHTLYYKRFDDCYKLIIE